MFQILRYRNLLLAAGLSLAAPALAEDAVRPDLRHFNNDMLLAAPDFNDFEDFLAKVDLDDDWEDLAEEFEERAQRITLLQKAALPSLGEGKAYRAHDELFKLLNEQVAYLRLKAQADFFQKHRLFLIDEIKAEPKFDNTAMQTHILQALEVARTMASRYKKLEEEKTAYRLIRQLARTSNENYEYYYNRFIRAYKNSPYLSRVHHIAGEYLFSKGKLDSAISKLKLALADKSSPIRPYTAFKLGWAHTASGLQSKKPIDKNIALQKADIAFRLAFKLLDNWHEYDPVFDLKKALTKDYVWLATHRGTSLAEISSFLKTIDAEDHEKEALRFRAIVAGENGDKANMNQYFAAFYKKIPEDPELPKHHLKHAALAYKQGDAKTVLDQYSAISKLFVKETPWYEEHSDDETVLQYYKDRLAINLRADAVAIHQNAQATREKAAEKKDKKAIEEADEILNAVGKLYALHVATFPYSPHKDDMIYNHSNLLYAVGDLQGSARMFSILSRKEDSKYRQEAAYNAVMAAYTADQNDKQAKLPEPGKAKKQYLISENKQLLIEKIDYFVKNFPTATEFAQTKYTAAQIYYDHGHYEEALKRFHDLVLKAPNTTEGESGLRTILGHYWDRQDWAAVVKESNRYLSAPAVKAAGHEEFLSAAKSQAQSQLSVSKK